VTCGDWDLRRMWPLQASIAPGLRTPPTFRSWANIKTTFRTHTGVPASGMMSMLNHLSLDHEGVHHRGIDDVRNLCRLTIRLLNEGANVAATWSNAERAAERAIHEKKLNEAVGRLAEKALARSRLPATVPEAVRAVFESGEAKLANEVERLRRLVGVFSDVL
jgi:hypothetical protein